MDNSIDGILAQIGLNARELRARNDLVPPAFLAGLPTTSREFTAGIIPAFGFGITGRTGAGKTSAMVCLLKTHIAAFMAGRQAERANCERPIRFARWVEWPETAHVLRSNAVRDPEMVASMVAACSKVPVLVLDDLGSERRKGDYQEDYACGELDYIISARYRACLPTWYTTNLDPAGLVAQYGARMTSRLIGENPLVTLAGQDLRVAR